MSETYTNFPIVYDPPYPEPHKRILPRDIFASGTTPGVSDIVIGGTISTTGSGGGKVTIDGGNNKITFRDSTNTVVGVIYAGTGNAFFSSSEDPNAGGVNLNSSSSQTVLFSPISGFDATSINLEPTSVTITGDTNVIGDLSATGTKPFDIPHPSRQGMRLRYVAIEAPEVLVMCRGECDSLSEISLPQHFIDVSEPGSVQYQVGGRVEEHNGHFVQVPGISWIATAIRKGYTEFEPEYTGKSAADFPGN